jgi:hypothetical protein
MFRRKEYIQYYPLIDERTKSRFLNENRIEYLQYINAKVMRCKNMYDYHLRQYDRKQEVVNGKINKNNALFNMRREENIKHDDNLNRLEKDLSLFRRLSSAISEDPSIKDCNYLMLKRQRDRTSEIILSTAIIVVLGFLLYFLKSNGFM